MFFSYPWSPGIARRSVPSAGTFWDSGELTVNRNIGIFHGIWMGTQWDITNHMGYITIYHDISNMGYIYIHLESWMGYIYISNMGPVWKWDISCFFLYVLENHAHKTRCNQQELQVPLSTTGLLPYMAPTTLTSILNTWTSIDIPKSLVWTQRWPIYVMDIHPRTRYFRSYR